MLSSWLTQKIAAIEWNDHPFTKPFHSRQLAQQNSRNTRKSCDMPLNLAAIESSIWKIFILSTWQNTTLKPVVPSITFNSRSHQSESIINHLKTYVLLENIMENIFFISMIESQHTAIVVPNIMPHKAHGKTSHTHNTPLQYQGQDEILCSKSKADKVP